MTLTEFLLARITDDEGDPWRGAVLADAGRAWGADEHRALAANERQWEARVSAECEAKRRIVERRMAYGREGIGDFRDGYTAALDDALALLAIPYADHPDYREEWKP